MWKSLLSMITTFFLFVVIYAVINETDAPDSIVYVAVLCVIASAYLEVISE